MTWSGKIRSLLGRGSSWPIIPTADYYLVAALQNLIADGPAAIDAKPIARIGPNTWTCKDRLVIVRYATEDEIRRIEGSEWRSIHYVIDDLLPAVSSSPELPDDYRSRLDRFCTTILPSILALHPTIVAPSRAILACFPGLVGKLLHPTYLRLCESAGSPEPPDAEDRIDVAFLGTRSHAGSIPLLEGIAERLEQVDPSARLHLFFGRHLPHSIATRPNVIDHPPMTWQAYRAFTTTARFHIGLAPVQPTAFAQARSVTKIMDHAAVGAAGIYSRREPFASVIEDGRNGMIVGDSPAEWTDAIVALARDRKLRQRIASGGQSTARDLGHPSVAKQFWARELGFSCPSS